MNRFPRLYAIADASFGDPVDLAVALFRGGARLLQVRNKRASAQDLLYQVEKILSLAPDDAEIIVNDRVDLALIAVAHGAHLGQTDLPPASARNILGPNRIIGLSTHNLEQALAADKQMVDYIAVGPVFPTTTKENPDPVIGIQGLSKICSEVEKPVVAIGGITLENVTEVLNAGATSIAIIRGLLDTNDIAFRTRDWLERLK